MLNLRLESSFCPATLLRWLAVLFAFRVSAQLLVLFYPALPLPAFEFWHSGYLPYPILVICQLALLFILIYFALRVHANNIKPHKKLGQLLLILGVIYFSVMTIRLGISLAELSDIGWFQRPIPSFFHMVLASYLMVLASCYLTSDKNLRGEHNVEC